MQYFFKYVLTYFLHLNSYLVTSLYNTICRAQLFCPSVSFGISFEHAVQLPFTVLLYSTFPDNYAFLSLSPSQIKNTLSADTVPIHGQSPLVFPWKRILLYYPVGQKFAQNESISFGFEVFILYHFPLKSKMAPKSGEN